MEAIQENLILFTTTLCLLSNAIVFLLSYFYWLHRQRSWRLERSLLQHEVGRGASELKCIQEELDQVRELYQEEQLSHTRLQSEHEHLEGKLREQKNELEAMHKNLSVQFENMANRILERKSEKFTQLNEKQIKKLIEPLGKDIKQFQEKVEQEAQQRFSLGEKVKELVEVNNNMSEVALNLTKALKGEAKTQGNWGEMILESLLEKSGLIKGEQYFMEHQLYDKEGKALRSDSKGKKMRPDAVIKYPDDRNVIVDSKVSLTAFSRAIDSDNDEEYRAAISQHILSIKSHIKALSEKGYDDHHKSLDFVLLFVPSEPAYIAALQAEPDLWNYAYDRRILLQSPTNLITSLKLIEELWKREAHNQNAQAIAERGSRLYDKFVGFVEKLEDVGNHLDKAKERYEEGFKQLSSGRGNLVRQAHQLKSMVGRTKKELPNALVDIALDVDADPFGSRSGQARVENESDSGSHS